ncbi:hypothetical protein [Microbulbifer sp. 2205BS26-8]|uniref:hypothetical protein n=1 Tax=Microbulbifer sp. 2205BS26-8 TaxID=3064386 RepID=UPI00273D42F2|nr:hypothetical protein [Microbulbifer sp. 2205BS26-8]MDP5208615.1 hypothetical protein [Microbulbifer sp. 2205BS26-8]
MTTRSSIVDSLCRSQENIRHSPDVAGRHQSENPEKPSGPFENGLLLEMTVQDTWEHYSLLCTLRAPPVTRYILPGDVAQPAKVSRTLSVSQVHSHFRDGHRPALFGSTG